MDVGPLNAQALHAASVSICLFGVQVNDPRVPNTILVLSCSLCKIPPFALFESQKEAVQAWKNNAMSQNSLLEDLPSKLRCLLGFCNKVETIEDAALSSDPAAAFCMSNWLKSKAAFESLSHFQSHEVQITVVTLRGTLHAMYWMPCRC